MKELLSSNYFPFGSQYYRAPSPQREDWDTDLKNMSELGFNTVKFWVQWRWNNPEEGSYYFNDIDELMDLSSKYNLKVMLNTIFDVAPAWIYEKYDGASMVTMSGRKIGPQTQPHRQIGGLGYCINNDRVMSHFYKFLEATITRYKDHPALEIWNVGSEPELTSSMAEMRDYANNIDKMGDMLCFCDNCKTKFKSFLNKKYSTIEKLNESWNRNYTDFNQAEIPLTRNTFNDIIDWRMFFVVTLGENVKKRFEGAKSIDNSKHPLMCHHVFIQGFPITSTANDPWNVGQFGDLHGFTQMDDASMIDILRSCAKDKPVISAEMLMLPGYTLDMPVNIDKNDIKRLIFSGISGNQKGFIFWQYRPEILGREAPTWGLTTLDGKETEWLNAYAEIGKVLQKNSDFLMQAKPIEAEVAILFNPENQIFAWSSTGKENTATDSILGIHTALYERNINVDFIHPIEFEEDILSNYKVLLIPFPYVINLKIAKAIKQWVSEGGILISEAYTAGWNIEKGHHEKIIPGYGLHEVFQARQGIVHPFDEEFFDIEISQEVSGIENVFKIKGAIIRAELISDGAEAIGFYKDGKPAVMKSNYGSGNAFLIGSYVGLVYHREKTSYNAEFLCSIIDKFSSVRKIKISDNKRVRVDLLNYNDNKLLIVQNKEDNMVDVEIEIELNGIKKFIEQFDESIIEAVSEDGISKIHLVLESKEVKVYREIVH